MRRFDLPAMAIYEPTNSRRLHTFTVGAAEGCDLLTLIFKIKIKRSQPAAAPTRAYFNSECLKVVSILQNLPPRSSGCPSDVRSLACVRRCQISDRDWEPRREPSAFALFMTHACAPLLCALRYGGRARETFGSTGFSVPQVSSLRTAATYSSGNRMGQLRRITMKKPAPTPQNQTLTPHHPTPQLTLKTPRSRRPRPRLLPQPHRPHHVQHQRAGTHLPRQSQVQHRIAAGQHQRNPRLGQRNADQLRRRAGNLTAQDCTGYKSSCWANWR